MHDVALSPVTGDSNVGQLVKVVPGMFLQYSATVFPLNINKYLKERSFVAMQKSVKTTFLMDDVS